MSLTNTLLQYCLLATIFYLYAKVPLFSNQSKKQHPELSRSIFARVFGATDVSNKADIFVEDKREEQEQPPSTPSPSMKRRSLKRSNSSRTSIHQQSKANSPSASPTPPTAHIVIGRRLVARPSPSTSSLSTCSDDHNDPPTQPSPIDENHRRFLKEAFCNVPMMEIDRKIKDANWDFNEAAAMLAQEDYTWQSVPRRRSIHK